MATRGTATNGETAAAGRIEVGDFPFPLPGGARESEYLTWLRNHSNYMAPRGLFDYVRVVAILVRGISINFLTVLPYLLLIALLFAWAHDWMLKHPFFMTLRLSAGAAVWLLTFPLAMPIFRIAAHRRSVDTGSDSTVSQRDLYERSFGALLLAILAAAALEVLPWMLEFLHDHVQMTRFSWQGGVAAASAGLALLSGANRLLSLLAGAKRAVAMVLIGVLGLLVPLIVVLSAADFLLHGIPPSFFWMFSPLALSVVGVLGIAIAMLLGLRHRAFTRAEAFQVVGLLAFGLALTTGVVKLATDAALEDFESHAEVDENFSKLELLAARFGDVGNRQELAPEVVALVDRFVLAGRHAAEGANDLESAAETVGVAGQPSTGEPGLWSKLSTIDLWSRTSRRQTASRLPLLSLGGALASLPDDALAPLRRELTRLAHEELLQGLAVQAGGEAPAADLLRHALVEHHLSVLTDTDTDTEAGSSAGREGDRLPTLSERFKALFGGGTHQAATLRARSDLHGATVTDLAVLIGEEELARTVTLKFQDVPGRATTARLAGKEELARQLTKQEMCELVLPSADSGSRASLVAARRRWSVALALPAFPEPADPDHERRTLATAHALAGLAEAGRTVRDEGTAELLGLSLAGFYTTAAHRRPSVHDAATPSALEDEPTTAEVARVAGSRLARRLLEDFDVDRLRALSFGLSLEPWGQAGPDEVGLEPHERKAFLELCRLPLGELVRAALSPLPEQDALPPREIWNQLPHELPPGYRQRVVLAARALDDDTGALASLAQLILLERVLGGDRSTEAAEQDRANIIDAFASKGPDRLGPHERAHLAAARFWASDSASVDELVTKLMFGVHGRLERAGLKAVRRQFTTAVMIPKVVFVGLLMVVIWLGCWLTVDVNLTSVHGLYRDRLASAFLVGKDTRGDVAIEEDVDLHAICRYEAGSTAPYHLINVALNLQGSADPGIRSRKSDFFVFSRRFFGGQRTGYGRSEVLEQYFPQADVATAMAISAAAASPNMGRITSPLLVAFMTLLNIRLGYWVPNPGLLEERGRSAARKAPPGGPGPPRKPPGFTFEAVFAQELRDIETRWSQLGAAGAARRVAGEGGDGRPSTLHRLVGLGLSGGGIRSAAFNLGLTQVLHQRGVFDHLDYLSTVSGGGYLGASISTLMRTRETLRSEIAGTVTVEKGDEQVVRVRPSALGETERRYRFTRRAALDVENGETIEAGRRLLKRPSGWGRCDVAGTVTSADADHVRVRSTESGEERDYRFSRFDTVVVQVGAEVKAGDALIERHDTLSGRFRWRVPPWAFVREMLGALDEKGHWVNLSDGGHIENLGAIELLRRRCKYVIVGDGEADPDLHFSGLATLMRYAQLDLGIRIDIDLDPIRLRKPELDEQRGAVSGRHWAIGRVTYPGACEGEPAETGTLLYLKSSLSGDETETIREYRHRNPTFPHQTTADQSFDEDQFEAYRALGQHVAEQALKAAKVDGKLSFDDLEEWFARLWKA